MYLPFAEALIHVLEDLSKIQVNGLPAVEFGGSRCSFCKLGPYHWFAWYICRLTRYTSRLVGLS